MRRNPQIQYNELVNDSNDEKEQWLSQYNRYSLNAPTIPLRSEKSLAHVQNLNRILKTYFWFRDVIWPVGFTGILIHDIYSFVRQPEDRYGNTLPQLFAGLSPNQHTWSSQWGSDLVVGTGMNYDGWQYWVPPVILAIPPVITTLPLLSHYFCRGTREYKEISNPNRPTLEEMEFAILFDGREGVESGKVENHLKWLHEIIDVAFNAGSYAQLKALKSLARIAGHFQEVDLLQIEKAAVRRDKSKRQKKGGYQAPSLTFSGENKREQQSSSYSHVGDSDEKSANFSKHSINFSSTIEADVYHSVVEEVISQASGAAVISSLSKRVVAPVSLKSQSPKATTPNPNFSTYFIYEKVLEEVVAKGDIVRKKNIVRSGSCGPGIKYFLDSEKQAKKQADEQAKNKNDSIEEVTNGDISDQAFLNVEIGVVNPDSNSPKKLEKKYSEQEVKQVAVTAGVQSDSSLLVRNTDNDLQRAEICTDLDKDAIVNPEEKSCDIDSQLEIEQKNNRNRRLIRRTALEALKLFSRYHVSRADVHNFDTKYEEMANEEKVENTASHEQQYTDSLVAAQSKSYIRPSLRYLTGNYLLGSLDRNVRPQAIRMAILSSFGLYYLYTQLRYWETILLKMFIYPVTYLSNKTICELSNRVWTYRAAIANYDCTVCGDWNFVYPGDVNSAQGCLNGLLASPLTPPAILNALNRLILHPFNTIDFSPQEWSSWLEKEWQTFLNTIEMSGVPNLRLFNLSRSIFNPLWPQDNKIQMLANFLRRIPVEKLDLHNQGIGPAMMTQLVPGLLNNMTRFIDVSYLALGDTGFLSVASILPQMSNLTTIRVAGNQISDWGLIQASNWLANSTATDIVLNTNQFGDRGVQGLAAAFFNVTRSIILDLSHNLLTVACMDAVGQLLVRVPTMLSLAACNLGDEEIIALAPYANYSHALDISYNSVHDNGLAVLAPAISNSAVLIYLNLDSNLITGVGIGILANFLPAALMHLSLAGLSLSGYDIAPLVQNLPASIRSINLGQNQLGDNNGTSIVVEGILNRNNSLEALDLSYNQMTTEEGIQATRLLPNSSLRRLNLAGNSFSLPGIGPAMIENLNGSNATAIILRNTGLTDADAEAIGLGLPKTNIEEIDISENPIGEAVPTIAENLITPPVPYANDLGDSVISRDKTRDIAHARARTQVQFFGVDHTQMSNAGALAMCRVAPSAGLSMANLRLANNQIDPNVVNPYTCQTSIASSNGFGFFSTENRALNRTSPELFTGRSNTTDVLSANLILSIAAGFIALFILLRALKPLAHAITTPIFWLLSNGNTKKSQQKELEIVISPTGNCSAK